MKMKEVSKNILFGVIVGDALGVPVEFKSREELKKRPVKDMIGYGTYNQPKGTWSDDGALTLCLAEALIQDYDIELIAKNFVRWKNEAYWSARGEVFDIGITTSKSLEIVEKLLKTQNLLQLRKQRYYFDVKSNGNGSLMRILPLLLMFNDQQTIFERFEIIWEVSAVTHGHIRSAISCLIYLEFAYELKKGETKGLAYLKMSNRLNEFFETMSISENEKKHFDRILKNDIATLKELDIKSTGYVIDSLEASLWCFLNGNDYKESVLKAVNLGIDTDTIGAITGGLAGIYYGMKTIPESWVETIARREEIMILAEKLEKKRCA